MSRPRARSRGRLARGEPGDAAVEAGVAAHAVRVGHDDRGLRVDAPGHLIRVVRGARNRRCTPSASPSLSADREGAVGLHRGIRLAVAHAEARRSPGHECDRRPPSSASRPRPRSPTHSPTDRRTRPTTLPGRWRSHSRRAPALAPIRKRRSRGSERRGSCRPSLRWAWRCCAARAVRGIHRTVSAAVTPSGDRFRVTAATR